MSLGSQLWRQSHSIDGNCLSVLIKFVVFVTCIIFYLCGWCFSIPVLICNCYFHSGGSPRISVTLGWWLLSHICGPLDLPGHTILCLSHRTNLVVPLDGNSSPKHLVTGRAISPRFPRLHSHVLFKV